MGRKREAWEREMDEEFRAHIAMRADDLVRGGMGRDEALRRARLELGSREAYKEQCREASGLRWPDELRQDLRYAARALRRSPGFAAVAVVSLALGIGANTVVFSALNALLWKPLPVKEPQRLYFVQMPHGSTQSYPNYRDLRDRNTAFSGLIAYRIVQTAMESGRGTERAWGYLASGNYFQVLGVRPALGRFFGPEEDRRPGASPYAVLSYSCWQRRFGGDPGIVGRTIRINALPYTVLGVAPAAFHGTELFYWPEIWVPMMMEPQIEANDWLEERSDWNCNVMGRLKPGVTAGEAEANLNTVAAGMAREHPQWNEGLRLSLARPGFMGDLLRGPLTGFMTGVMALAALVLLAACANLASLLGARASDRFRELAIRVSIGAGRARILRQLLTEAVLLAVLGGAAGCALAVVLLRLLSGWHAPLGFPVQLSVDPDPRVFAFAAAVSLLTGLLFGLVPARQAWKADPNLALKGVSSAAVTRRWALRDLLLASQVALCCVLVTASLVSVRGLARAASLPLGFRAPGVSVVGFDLGLARYRKDEARAFQKQAAEAVARMPGVTAAAYASSVPLSIDQSNSGVFPMDEPTRRHGIRTSYYQVSPGYFRVMGTRLIGGREFTWHDDANAPRVAIVNEAFVRQVLRWGGGVGKRFRNGSQGPPIEVIGVVEDGKYVTLAEDPQPAMFLPALQSYNPTTVLVVRSQRPEGEMAAEMRRAVAGLDPRVAVYGVGSLTQMLGLAFLPARAASIALGAFGVLALMLAVTGIYGLGAYTVSRRAREIGIRVAMGARPAQVLRFVLARTALLVALGSALGLAGGMAAGKLLGSIVYQASASDPVVLAGVAATMAGAALGAVYAPARRVLGLDPLRVLRHE